MERLQDAQQFEQAIASATPVVVKFFTTWCPDCVRMDQFIGEVIAAYPQFKWYDINRDDVPDIAETYNVMGIPSLLVFQNGEKIAHLHSANAKTREQVEEFLQTIKG
ncbi:thioredoxin family protein [Anoxybacillus flavithermus]|uniref:thioredoxin family protein n=1 Tax=Anoxybacillus TaxID=150247 RepID=UPI000A6E53AA|nr:thioredoxin family protein [Anoxybacillus flavithermus]MBE2929877.1 thioredoxin family protein [Anoxybacillus flavithermus]MBE2956819.1 thioredoxin family protein [Anoxybacillus flavithermus]